MRVAARCSRFSPTVALLLLVLVVTYAIEDAHAYGEPSSSLPSYQERTFAALINVARVGPAGYRSNYMSGYSTNGILTQSPRAPLYIDSVLSQTAHAHSTDLTTCHQVQFSSCDGTSWVTRVRNSYSCPYGSLGENLQVGYSAAPLDGANDALCSWTQASDGTYYCCPDGGTNTAGQACDGGRNLYLSVSVSRVGVGLASDSSNGLSYWTTDMGSCNTQTYTNSIASGSHIVQGGNTRFFATFWDGSGTPQSAQVVINGAATDLSLDAGSPGQGNYYMTSSTGSGCRSYYFQFTSGSGGVYRYPETGYFNTYGEGSCLDDWASDAVPNSAPTVPGVPQGVTVGSLTTSSAVISWSAPATNGGQPVTSYALHIAGNSQSWDYTTSDSSFTATGMTAGTTYTVTVSAQNSVGTGPASAGTTFITLADNTAPSPSPSPSASSPTPLPSSGLPQSYNFHAQSGCNVGIPDQGHCGSCYAFSTAAAASDRWCRARSQSLVFSPQEILDCGKSQVWFGNSGCDGGDPYQAALLMANSGFPTSDTIQLAGGCRPYTCYSGSCSSNPTCSTTCQDGSTATKYQSAGASRVVGLENMQLEIFNNGPIVTGFDICNSFYNFFSDTNNAGKVYTTQCSSSSSDYMGGHAVSIVGWGTDPNGVDYWLVANSWNTWWADNGYFRIQRGVNLCGFENWITAITVAQSGRRTYGGVTMLEDRSSASAPGTGQAVTVNGESEFVHRGSQLVLDTWFLSNHAPTNASLDPSKFASQSGGKRAAVPPPGLSTNPGFSVSSVNSATVQVAAGQNVFVDFVATDGVTTVNLASTVSFAANGGVSSVAAVTAASVGGGGGGLSTGAIIGIVVGSVVGAVLLAGATVAVAAVAVVAVKRSKSREVIEQRAIEMEEQAAPEEQAKAEDKRGNRSTWFTRRLMFQSITARSPPVKFDH